MGKLRFLSFLSVALAVLLLCSGQARAEERIALVIGNSDYNFSPLANPRNDAQLMAGTLRGLGFDVIEALDASQKDMKRAVRDFGKKLDAAGKDGVGLFYYAGHGVQVQGANYLIPVDAEIETEGDVDIEAINAQSVLSMMEFSGARLNFVIMDACRNNPFKRSFRSATRGLAKMEAPTGSLIAYATAPGDVAADGTGVNSPYTLALSQMMNTPGLPVERMFREVRNLVRKATNDQQTPWESSSLVGDDFYFNGGPASAAQPTTAPQPRLVMTPDMMAWQSIQTTTNPEEIEAFILAFGDSPFAGMARAKLKALKEKEQDETLHPDNPNVVWGENGWRPADGYTWVSDDPDDYRVMLLEGSSHPDNPNVVWGEDGWKPADGYTWVSDDPDDYRVMLLEGSPHPDHPNVVWNDDGWWPADGYTWVSEDPDDFRVVSDLTAATPADQAVETAGPDPPATELAALHVIEVPSPAGFRDEWERREQLARLTDWRIDDEIARATRTLEAMKADFEQGSGELEDWLALGIDAEKEALMASFQILLGDTLDSWKVAWDAYPGLERMAENGLRYLSFARPAAELSENPWDTDAGLEMARLKMLELYSILRDFDEDLTGEGGPPADQFASFLIDYSDEAARWALARQQIEMIVGNMDRPDGEQETRKALSRLLEDLVEERNRRR